MLPPARLHCVQRFTLRHRWTNNYGLDPRPSPSLLPGRCHLHGAPAVRATAIAEMIHNSGPVAFTVLVLLLLASIFSWTIMLSKWSSFGRARSQGKRFLRAFRKSEPLKRGRGGRRPVPSQSTRLRLQRDPRRVPAPERRPRSSAQSRCTRAGCATASSRSAHLNGDAE